MPIAARVSLVLFLVGTASIGVVAATAAQDTVISRGEYAERLHGFWLGQSIANWTGLTTELSRVAAPFHTDADWGGAVEPNVWGDYPKHASRVAFFLPGPDRVWGADDDTDIEYLYLHLLDQHATPLLTGEQIRSGWLTHIHSNESAPLSSVSMARENYLWVSNERAFYLMRDRGLTPPATSVPANNPDHAMIDAQLTTELFGLLSPTRPDLALRMARLPIRTTASGDAASIAEFYVVMHALAPTIDRTLPLGDEVRRIAGIARRRLPEGRYPARMYDFVRDTHAANPDPDAWAAARDAVYRRYQLGGEDGYEYRRAVDAGINFAASLVSLFYGDGDLKRTVRIGTLAGWDSDNPTATWGGLLGFVVGREGVERAFDRSDLPEAYWIHRTRKGFPDRTPNAPGEDTFALMAERGVSVIDRVVSGLAGGRIDADAWVIPAPRNSVGPTGR